jgi:hypothetical protein
VTTSHRVCISALTTSTTAKHACSTIHEACNLSPWLKAFQDVRRDLHFFVCAGCEQPHQPAAPLPRLCQGLIHQGNTHGSNRQRAAAGAGPDMCAAQCCWCTRLCVSTQLLYRHFNKHSIVCVCGQWPSLLWDTHGLQHLGSQCWSCSV